MSEPFDLHNKRLSLIDVSFEDDSLYSSPSRDFSFPHFPGKIEVEERIVNELEFKEWKGVEACFDSIEERGEEGEREESSVVPELAVGGGKKSGKYNLRKSLAWDSAFFTSAGVLEPDELSSMIGGEERFGKCMLPGIEEEAVYKSTDSISTLASDNLTLETIEADLFSDIRASIQKSSNSSSSVNSGGKLGSGIRSSHEVQSSKKGVIGSRDKAKIKAVPKTPNAIMQGSGRVTNQVVNSTPSTRKPPKVAEKVSPNLTSTSKRVSLGSNRGKVEKNIAKSPLGNNSESAKNFTSKGVNTPTLGASRNALPKPRLPFRTSLGSTKTMPSASSSIDSSGSISSDNSSKSFSSTATRRVDSRTGSRSSSLTVKSTLRVASKIKGQLTNSRPSPHLKSVTRLSCSISPASSVSEWSSGSLSPTSTLNKGSNSSRTSLDASSSIGDGETTQGFNHLNHCSGNSNADVTQVQVHDNGKRVSAGGSSLLHPDSVKPTGLRMPSPKLGFFDGVKSALRTPNRSTKSNLAVPGDLPKVGGVSVSPNGGSNEAKHGKLQPARTMLPIRGAKVASQKPAMEKEPRSRLQESSNAAPKITSASRKEKHSSVVSVKVQNRTSSENGRTNNFKGDKVAQKQNAATNNSISEMDASPLVSKDNISPKVVDISPGKDVQIAPAIKEPDSSTGNSSAVSELNKLTMPKKEKTSSEDQVESLIKQVGDIDIHEMNKEHINDPSHNDNREVNGGLKEEF